jgi:hypothetical protein
MEAIGCPRAAARFGLAVLSVFALSGCPSAPAPAASAPPSPVAAAAPAPAVPAPAPAAAPAPAPDILATLRELRAAAQAATDANHPVEALQLLVALLAENGRAAPDADADRAAARAELARGADIAIAAVGAGLTLEPADAWLADGVQIAGNSRELGRGKGLMPSVRLVANYGFGKSVVADAPIRFGFVDGVGDLTTVAATDASGQAATTVRSLARPDKPALVRAMLVVTSRGLTRSFPEVARDFAYLPSSRSARLYALEKPAGGSAVQARAPLLDALARGLAGAGLDLLAADASLDPDAFQAAFAGDKAAFERAVSRDGTRAGYIVFGSLEYDAPRQLVYLGKTYDIYTVDVRAQVRIVRADGSVALSRPALAVRGQGGTAAAAVEAALALARDAVEADLKAAGPAIKALD